MHIASHRTAISAVIGAIAVVLAASVTYYFVVRDAPDNDRTPRQARQAESQTKATTAPDEEVAPEDSASQADATDGMPDEQTSADTDSAPDASEDETAPEQAEPAQPAVAFEREVGEARRPAPAEPAIDPGRAARDDTSEPDASASASEPTTSQRAAQPKPGVPAVPSDTDADQDEATAPGEAVEAEPAEPQPAEPQPTTGEEFADGPSGDTEGGAAAPPTIDPPAVSGSLADGPERRPESPTPSPPAIPGRVAATKDAAEPEAAEPKREAAGTAGTTPRPEAGADSPTPSPPAIPDEPGAAADASKAEPREKQRAPDAAVQTGRAAGRPSAEGKATQTDAPDIEVRTEPRAEQRSADGDAGYETDTDASVADEKSHAPDFDVVRVDPSGDAVIAGRAPPDSRVTVMAGDTPVVETRTNAKGEFVAIPPTGLESGKQRLTLEAETQAGRTRTSETAVVVSVPASVPSTAESESAGGSERPMAVRVPREGEGQVELLQQPAGDAEPAGQSLRLDTIRYTVSGHIDVRGRATPGDLVVLAVDGSELGHARVGANGTWRIVPTRTIEPGMHEVRLEQRDSAGTVVASISTPFSSQPMVGARADSDFVVIQPGNNLWSIAQRAYGSGTRYHVIYRANTDQIEDPDLIYPGQVFVLPEARE